MSIEKIQSGCVPVRCWGSFVSWKESLTTLILVRHGESEWNRAGRIQGQINSPLTDLGINQAKAIREYLSGILLNQQLEIYTSPLDRALQTAEIIAQGIEYPSRKIIIEERLNDFNVGEISGTFGWDKVAEIFPEQAQLRLQDPMRFHPSGGESGAEFEARLRSLLEDLKDDGTLKLMVSHGIVNKFIRGILKNLSGKEMVELGESQNTIYRLEEGEETEIKIPPTIRGKN
ncbi:MAG TPA: histidine phosphatase family protein [Candidatus Lambdaproteobacteria bacterium]|nr:histidine phosphatase family protein [Candidatus Lambdaproteobacteria bacterium]